MAKFDLANVLGDVSKLDTGTEQIIKIDIDRIDPDPNNFYSLEGIDELAANIETVGLLDALRVRPEGERYVIVSGHRRRAAILLIRDGGSEQFDDGVPCIVEYGDATPAMRELRLIYANAATRVMSSADLSKQAERVTELLYELKEQGVEFPGRMRDHVAEACRVSASKLARLHAIRSNLDSELLPYYDEGVLVEDAAYQLSRLPANLQVAIAHELSEGKRKKMPVAATVKEVHDHLEALTTPLRCRAHAGGPDCHNVEARVVCSVFAPYYWQICDGTQCCMDCYRGKEGCRMACKEAKARFKLDKEVEAEKQAERQKKEQDKQEILRKQISRRCQELLPLVEASGLKDDERIFDSYSAAKVKDVREWAAGNMKDRTFYSDEAVVPWRIGDLRSMANRLHTTAADLLGEKPASVSDPDTPTWQTGDPTRPGRYFCRVDMETTKPIENRCTWTGEFWEIYGAKLDDRWKVVGWWPLPEEVV